MIAAGSATLGMKPEHFQKASDGDGQQETANTEIQTSADTDSEKGSSSD